MRMGVRKSALVSCMAATYVAISYLPGFPVIGAEGAKIGIVSGITPVYGFLMGPWLGALAALLGAVVSRFLRGGGPFVWLTLPCMPLSAFITGSLSRPCLGRVRGWMVSALTLAALIAAWYGTGVGQAVPYFPILHWLGLAIILIFRGRLADFFRGVDKKRFVSCVALCSYSATVTAHMYGSLVFILAAGLFLKVSNLPSLFVFLIPISAIERSIFTAISVVVGTPLIIALRGRFPGLRPPVKRRRSYGN